MQVSPSWELGADGPGQYMRIIPPFIPFRYFCKTIPAPLICVHQRSSVLFSVILSPFFPAPPHSFCKKTYGPIRVHLWFKICTHLLRTAPGLNLCGRNAAPPQFHRKAAASFHSLHAVQSASRTLRLHLPSLPYLL